MLQCDSSHAGLIQPFRLNRRCTRGWQTIIKALRQGAGVAVAGFIWMLAGFVAGGMFEYPQWHIDLLAAQG